MLFRISPVMHLAAHGERKLGPGSCRECLLQKNESRWCTRHPLLYPKDFLSKCLCFRLCWLILDKYSPPRTPSALGLSILRPTDSLRGKRGGGGVNKGESYPGFCSCLRNKYCYTHPMNALVVSLEQ